MGRLIDADHLLFLFNSAIELRKKLHRNTLDLDMMVDAVNNEPTAYDPDKVVEQLKTARDGYSTAQLMTATNDELVKHFIAKEKAMNLAIKIVKAGGKNDD